MNRDTKATLLPALTLDILKEEGFSAENVFTELWRRIGVKTILNRSGFTKRSGTSIHKVVYMLSLWLWLKKESIGMFVREDLQGMGKDVLYDTMNREDLNWRKHHEYIAHQATQIFQSEDKKAFVLDDTIVRRFGNKMPGVSCHFDHTSGRYIMGQQVLTLGLVGEEGFVPLDSKLFVSQSKAQLLSQPFKDGRSTVAKRYHVAQSQTKLEMATSMIRRSLRGGIEANYLLADAWFGKAMIRLSEESSLVAILGMKKNMMKYRVSEYIDGSVVKQELNVKALYRHYVR